MMRPAEMTWISPKSMGDIPSKRSGHSLTVVADNCYLFGGNDFRRPAGPNNELYKLDISSNDVYWTKIENNGRIPEPRSHHTAVLYNNKIIIFGGFRSSNIRYNDIWILDISNDEWSQPHPGITETRPDGEVVFKRNWTDCPLPRGSHTATIIGNLMYVFGGYGGSGYARRDFNDTIVLDLETWEWKNLDCKGEIPEARSGHQAVSIHENLYVIGGWNSMEQFSNVYILNTTDNVWTKPALQGDFGPPRWNFSAVSVFAVPYWKIFVFGGNSGNLNEDVNPQGEYLNDVCVLETGSKTWTRPNVLGTIPTPRGETPAVYESKGSRLITFGGWANRWFGDLFICKVGDVVGPSYAIESITPSIGPITGSTRCTITGSGFKSGGNIANVRFACIKGSIEVTGEVTSDSTIEFDTPNFEKYGAQSVEGRVSVGGKSLTNSIVYFNYFSVACADTILCFGPAIIDGCVASSPATLVIQSKDSAGINRSCGMDEFTVTVSTVTKRKDKEIIETVENVAVNIVDQNDGTYIVTFQYPNEGLFDVSVVFNGTFRGIEGPVRGSPYRVHVIVAGDSLKNEVNGPLMMESIRKQIKDVKDYSTNVLKSLKRTIAKDDMDSLLKVKETLKDIEFKKKTIELSNDTSRASLLYFKSRGGSMDKMIEQVNNVMSLWVDVNRQIPLTNNAIMPLTKVWSGIIQEQIESYNKDILQKQKDFKTRSFWDDQITYQEALNHINDAEKFLSNEINVLNNKTQVCQIFDFPQLMKLSNDAINDMKNNLNDIKSFWNIYNNLQTFINQSKKIKWNEINSDVLDEEAKNQVKNLKNCNKNIKWCKAYKLADKISKDFLNTIPLILLLSSKAMRERHWNTLQVVTKKNFTPPYSNPSMELGDILALNLHEYSNDVEEICDQASKELKIENTLLQLNERWEKIEWVMETYKDTDIPLLKLAEEDFESLEADQLTVQGMLASRFVKQFEKEVQDWQKHLANIADGFIILGEIQRTWSYLEPLFIGSDEVKRELPEDAKRFEGIDLNVKKELKTAYEIHNVDQGCNQDGLLKRLENIQEQLEICKKSLSDFLDGRRRQFPRYYFTSESDLLDILSNGSTPEKVLKHTAKVYLSCDTLILDKNERTDSDRPYAIAWVSGVGVETVEFEPRVALDGKVEIYQQTILDAMKLTLYKNLKRSLVRYQSMSRPEWLMHKKPQPNPKDHASDPAQIILLTLAINYVEEVEQVFRDINDVNNPNPNAMLNYKEKQVEQLNDLIRLTQKNLSKSDRTRVMVCITMDAHSRDIVIGMIRDKVQEVSAFQWQSQLKHKYRKPPPTASFINRDLHLRGDDGERAEVAICDAILPYDYEYLGNGPRLVITPLTDRIYVTATQALNLKMGCAPAGPAGTGKTETTKDLASALAKCCYVFNCSPEMDYLGLGNIFKGLASSGSWGCFDEFNRLIPEVLSVCTVQFKAVCDGVKAESVRIVIESDEISLDPTCGAFITMNPGYLGRSELPEGLKALFRPITVMVPDLVLICENMLMAEGFTQAKVLASKFYGLYSLLRDLLSKQLHYDWGLRAVKSVLVVAGGFKRMEPDLLEEALLMRALRDFNIPKIVREDEVVFFGLLGDLFPGINPPRKVNPALEEYVEMACESMGNNPDELFRLKVVQLEELLEIRHCVFVMGPPGAGKTQCWKTLAEARTIRGDKTKYVDINPKSVKTEELYGYISMATREWKDGLLSKVMRDLGEIPDTKPKWIILDGDLDANWIESMNSVMDDNKMLTLASNERIPLKPHMRLIFEIRDLRFATPATVSRAGILYISTDDGTQWNSLIQSWLKRLEANEAAKEKLTKCFSSYVRPTLKWMIKTVSPIVSLQDMNFVQTLLYMLDGILTPNILVSEAPDAVEKVFIFAMIWSMGSALTVTDDGTDNRKLFSDWWRSEWRIVKLPTQYTIFDYWYDSNSNTYELWSKSPFLSSEMMEYDTSTPMASVTVPTPETCSVTYWMKILVGMRRAVMLAGPSGTGKTQIVNGMLSGFDSNELMSTTINFNFYTTSAALMNTMGIPLMKKAGTNYGPPGQAKLIYFVDDINLPEVDLYDTQSAIALLRQHIEYEHVYDLSKLTVKTISNTQFIACMNPTAGSFEINPRLQRWFATFAIGLPDTISLHTIYLTFLSGHLKHFDDEVQVVAKDLVRVAVSLHREIMNNFRKTAQNFHYEFNIRHISNVFQGLLVSHHEQFKTPEKFIYLWLHESERVYGDRLVSYEDLNKYNVIVQQQHKKIFPNYNISRFYSLENSDPLVFCHFADNIQDKVYDMVTSMNKMSHVLEEALKEYNDTNATMDLVLFADAMKHVARIVRVISNSGGHALLVGVGGSGKQSLSRLAAFICGFVVKQIVISSNYGINDLKEDLKWMYNKAGIKEEGVMFLLTDSQITNERFLVYINDLLASGNIPDLFAVDEVDNIINTVTNKVKALGKLPDRTNCWEYFINEIRKNLHVVLAFSPVGDAFRTRARRFPAIVNCTVIDWFQPWPMEALYSVGKKFMTGVELGSQTVRNVIEGFLPYSFTQVNQMANKFRAIERRHVYTTPKSYLELLKLYSTLLATKVSDADKSIDRLANGLQKLRETAAAVTQIEADLKISLEEADQKRTIAEGIAEVVSKEKAIVEVETANAQIKAKEVARIQEEVMEKQRSTEEDLAKAEPLVEKSMAALNTLDKKQLGEAKTMTKPPTGVDEVFAATMVLLANVHPNVIVQKNGKVKDRSWDACKRQLLGSIPEYIDFLKSIKTGVDEGTVPKQNFAEVRYFLELPYFNFDEISKKNSAAAGLCQFVISIVQYYDVVITVEPKRKALQEANEMLESANSQLTAVKELVADLEFKLAKLTSELNAANAEKQEALDAVEKGQRKLDLAQRLTNALASENVRWAENIISMESDKQLLIGDVLLASAFISYVGPFNKVFRDKLMNQIFTPYLQEKLAAAIQSDATSTNSEALRVPLSQTCDPMKILTNSAEIATWGADGLPSDQVSLENGTIVCNSARWPLIIDPQLQGIKWLKQKESSPERNLQVVRLGQTDLLRKLEKCLENGYSIIIENIGESIDAVLNPVIQRAVIKRGKKMYIKLGDTEVEFHKDFKLFLHTKLSNPHYPPEIQAETTLINFTVTAAGLEDQLLALVVRKERLDLALLSEDLVKQQNDFTIKVKELEDNILSKLATAQGDITEDVDLIESLETTKKIANEIATKQVQAANTQSVIKMTSEKYRGVANRASLLFFLMNDLVKIHTYYIYSLEAFTQVFFRGIDLVPNVTTIESTEESNAASSNEIPELNDIQLAQRCSVLIDSITRTVFSYIRRGLFETDKVTIATLLTLRIAVNDNKLTAEEVEYLVESKQAPDPGNMGPLHEWLPSAIWPKIKALEGLKRFSGLGDNMQSDSDDWQKWFDSELPEIAKLPGDYQKALNPFDRLILLRALRPDRVTTALKLWIEDMMGKEYIFQKPFDMPSAFLETSNQTPTFFVLFAGVDPTPWVETLGKEKGITFENGNFKNISMGQGQEKPAEAVVEAFAKNGGWVMLQNCHLMQSWVPKLERLLEVVQENAHPDFRCFISAEPPPMASWKNMPESLMQGSIKIANEAPADIKSNMLRGWANFSHERIENCPKKDDFKACLFALCWFHSIVLGRRRFGQQGWSRKYSFNTGDLTICANVLQTYLESNPTIPWDDLRYIFGEIMYGGHITDAWDRRTCNNYLSVIINTSLFKNMEFGSGFHSPDPATLDYQSYITYVEDKLPTDSPVMFGLHPNAEIGYLTNWTAAIFETILGLGGSGGSSGGSTAQAASSSNPTKESMDYLLKNLPENFSMITIMDLAQPLLSQESGPFVVVALQECQRMNNLLTEIRRSLIELEKGLKGQLNMSQPMEDLMKAISINQWPGRNPFSQCRWESKAWPSMKNLLSQYADMLLRVKQLVEWSKELITPISIWISGLFNPTSYLTAVMQVTARRKKLPLDQMTTETYISTFLKPEMIESHPEDGAFIHGLFIEGARWPTGDEAGDTEMLTGVPIAGYLVDSRLKELLPPLPVVYVKAVPVQPTWEPSAVGYLRRVADIYECPVYITSFRGPTYVFLATLRTVDPNSKWVLTGTAILMQTDY